MVVRGIRNFSPGQNPRERVLPTQLIEAVFNGLIFFAFYWWLLIERPTPKGSLLFIYLACYGVLRICLDFLRVSSSRPRIGPFSEAQVVASFITFFSVGVLATGVLKWFI